MHEKIGVRKIENQQQGGGAFHQTWEKSKKAADFRFSGK
jgi:hypothetical protein